MWGLEVVGLRVERSGRSIVVVDHLGVAAGELAVVVAPAGTGKTSLASALAGVIPAAGEVRVWGRPCVGAASMRRRAGLAVALQDGTRLGGCTVAEALSLAAGHVRDPVLVFDVLPRLRARASVAVERLSGGELQLLRLGCAWLASPGALILDSPTVGLAADAADAVIALTRREMARGASVLWLDQPDALLPATPRLTIADGRLRDLAGLQTASSRPTD
jgi:ABC-type branched-subunit amino acid transport system ATPase component